MSHAGEQLAFAILRQNADLWRLPVSPETGLATGKPVKVYEFPDGESRIDYPVWSPDGKWVLFDRFRPQGGDIWMIKNFD